MRVQVVKDLFGTQVWPEDEELSFGSAGVFKGGFKGAPAWLPVKSGLFRWPKPLMADKQVKKAFPDVAGRMKEGERWLMDLKLEKMVG